MKKIIVLSLACLLSIGCIFSAMPKNDLTKGHLYGKVKSIREICYKAVYKDFVIVKGERAKRANMEAESYTLYDEQGNEMEHSIYRPDGSVQINFVSTYDYRGYKTTKNSYDSKGALGTKIMYKYDEGGNEIEVNMYAPDGSLYLKTTSKNDGNGNKIEENWYTPDGRLMSKYTNKYDGLGNKTEQSSYDDGVLNIRYTYKVDANGNDTERNGYDASGNLISKNIYQYEYDNKRNWTKRIDFENEVPQFVIERGIEYY